MLISETIGLESIFVSSWASLSATAGRISAKLVPRNIILANSLDNICPIQVSILHIRERIIEPSCEHSFRTLAYHYRGDWRYRLPVAVARGAPESSDASGSIGSASDPRMRWRPKLFLSFRARPCPRRTWIDGPTVFATTLCEVVALSGDHAKLQGLGLNLA